MPCQRATARRQAGFLALVFASLAYTAQGAQGKSVLLPIKRRDGGLYSRDLLQNATVPLHGAVRDYGYDPQRELHLKYSTHTIHACAGTSMQICS